MIGPELKDCRRHRRRSNLVFTSAGDRSSLERWLKGERHFDLWITYYGDQKDRYADVADIYSARKGSKFQNLKFAFDTWPGVLAEYNAVLVMDDDIVIGARGINTLFELRERLDLWVLQPAFSPLGKISFPITRVQPRCEFRYTDFVEMTCPLFRKDKLDQFMAVYDPVLAGFGTEWWFLDALGPDLEGKVAVVDKVPCINPHDRRKGGIREISRFQSQELREATWREIRRKHSIKIREDVQREFQVVLKSKPMQWACRLKALLIDGYIRARHVAAVVRDDFLCRRRGATGHV